MCTTERDEEISSCYKICLTVLNPKEWETARKQIRQVPPTPFFAGRINCMFPVKQSTIGFYGTFLVVLLHCHRKYRIFCRYVYMVSSISSQKSEQMLTAQVKKWFRCHDTQSGNVPQGFTRDQLRSHPLLMMPWNRLFCLDKHSLTLMLLSSPYNKISTFKLLIWTICGLRELLGDGQVLSGG